MIKNQIHPQKNTKLKGCGIMKISENKRENKRQHAARYFSQAAVFLILLLLCTPAVADSFIPVMKSDTLDYYVGYGEPELTAALRGNQEFKKGETATAQITIANKGMLERVAYREYVVFEEIDIGRYVETVYDTNDDPTAESYKAISLMNYTEYLGKSTLATMSLNEQNTLAQTEMKLESYRINAQSVNMKFSCDSPYIEVDESGDYTYWEGLPSGYYNVAMVPIKISPNTPAGKYLIDMTVNYTYPSNARMIKAGNGTDGFSTFLYSDSYIQEFTAVSKVIQVPIYVSEGAVFEATNVDGTITAGKKKTVAVTYTNIGDKTAYDAEAKLSLMYPLSTSQNKGLLGDVAPGESVTIEYQISSNSTSTEKVYGVNSDIRYYNEDNELEIAPAVKLEFEMANSYNLFTFKNMLIGVLLLVALTVLYNIYKTNKRKREGAKPKEGTGTDSGNKTNDESK